MSEQIHGIFIWGIVFNLLFGVFGFAFTTFATDPAEYDLDIALDVDQLWKNGIIFVNATSFNLTYGDDWHYFTENNKELRVRWYDPVIPLLAPAGIYFERQSIVEQYTDTWIYPLKQEILLGESRDIVQWLSNGTLIEYWETDNNWTRLDVANGIIGFISTIPPDENNITKAVFETGILTLTIGEPESTSSFSAENFIDWYWSAVFTFDYSEVPFLLNWLMKIIVILNLVSAIFVVRELSPIPS